MWTKYNEIRIAPALYAGLNFFKGDIYNLLVY